jgi:hypothetical protein
MPSSVAARSERNWLATLTAVLAEGPKDPDAWNAEGPDAFDWRKLTDDAFQQALTPRMAALARANAAQLAFASASDIDQLQAAAVLLKGASIEALAVEERSCVAAELDRRRETWTVHDPTDCERSPDKNGFLPGCATCRAWAWRER